MSRQSFRAFDAVQNCHRALGYCLSVIFLESRFALRRIMFWLALVLRPRAEALQLANRLGCSPATGAREQMQTPSRAAALRQELHVEARTDFEIRGLDLQLSRSMGPGSDIAGRSSLRLPRAGGSPQCAMREPRGAASCRTAPAGPDELLVASAAGILVGGC